MPVHYILWRVIGVLFGTVFCFVSSFDSFAICKRISVIISAIDNIQLLLFVSLVTKKNPNKPSAILIKRDMWPNVLNRPYIESYSIRSKYFFQSFVICLMCYKRQCNVLLGLCVCVCGYHFWYHPTSATTRIIITIISIIIMCIFHQMAMLIMYYNSLNYFHN